jgi:hypothetical protein
MKRRGILAAAAALVAGIMAKYAAQPVAATAGNSEGGALVIGANDIFGALPRSKNTATNPTQLTNTSGTVTASPTSFFHQGAGLIVAASDGAEGIMGFANGPFGVGVWGVSNRGRAVYGELTGSGAADGGKAVVGDALGNTNAYGVYGTASSASSIGVYGQGGQGIGVHGESTSGNGVHGRSVHLFGGWFDSGSDQGSGGVIGVARAAGTIGVQGFAVAPATYAGYFTGDLVVKGSFGVTGTKFAVVKGADGKHRGMYAVESPECWFEDVGTARLTSGRAEVKLDPLFAQHVHAEEYHVFLTPYGAVGALRVAARRGDGFTVEEIGGSSSGTFSWKVQGRRNDISGERLPVWELPPAPNVSAQPKPTTTPASDAPPAP